MLDRGISWLPVVNEEGRLIGMVPDGACAGAAKSGPSTILVYEAGFDLKLETAVDRVSFAIERGEILQGSDISLGYGTARSFSS